VEDMAQEAKNFKKIKKVLKEALQTEKDKNAKLESEVEKLRTKSEEMEREIREKEQKYLDLYMENTQQHEQIIQLQNKVQLLEQQIQVNFLFDGAEGKAGEEGRPEDWQAEG